MSDQRFRWQQIVRPVVCVGALDRPDTGNRAWAVQARPTRRRRQQNGKKRNVIIAAVTAAVVAIAAVIVVVVTSGGNKSTTGFVPTGSSPEADAQEITTAFIQAWKAGDLNQAARYTDRPARPRRRWPGTGRRCT